MRLGFRAKKPELVQSGELTSGHFERHSVWVACQSCDSDEAWYDDTDEETFRPWSGELPVDPSQGMFLVKTRFTLADGTELSGFVTPNAGNGEASGEQLGTVQPQIFLPTGKPFGFWLGMFGKSEAAAKELYAALRRDARAIFPARFATEPACRRT